MDIGFLCFCGFYCHSPCPKCRFNWKLYEQTCLHMCLSASFLWLKLWDSSVHVIYIIYIFTSGKENIKRCCFPISEKAVSVLVLWFFSLTLCPWLSRPISKILLQKGDEKHTLERTSLGTVTLRWVCLLFISASRPIIVSVHSWLSRGIYSHILRSRKVPHSLTCKETT